MLIFYFNFSFFVGVSIYYWVLKVYNLIPSKILTKIQILLFVIVLYLFIIFCLGIVCYQTLFFNIGIWSCEILKVSFILFLIIIFESFLSKNIKLFLHG
jgi:hypothetical protein